MSVVHINHIRKKLETDFCPHIDMSDYVGKPEAEVLAARLSRALAAFALAEVLDLSAEAAAASVTDGFDDNGVDAVGIDKARSAVVLVQSKWDGDGKGSPALGDVQKFAQGFRDLITPNFDRFKHQDKGKSCGSRSSAGQYRCALRTGGRAHWPAAFVLACQARFRRPTR
jgi:hypothetical protein